MNKLVDSYLKGIDCFTGNSYRLNRCSLYFFECCTSGLLSRSDLVRRTGKIPFCRRYTYIWAIGIYNACQCILRRIQIPLVSR